MGLFRKKSDQPSAPTQPRVISRSTNGDGSTPASESTSVQAANIAAPARVPVASPASISQAEARIIEIGRELLDLAKARQAGMFSGKFYQDKLMDWAMQDHGFKVQMFRFVDTFPVLTTSDMVHDHLVDYLSSRASARRRGWTSASRPGGSPRA